jgi:hypothetical protein
MPFRPSCIRFDEQRAVDKLDRRAGVVVLESSTASDNNKI